MNAAVRKISQEISKLRTSSRQGSNEVDSDTSFESVFYPNNESSSKWSPFRRRAKQIEKTDETKRLSGSYLGRRHSRNENDQDIEVMERKYTVNSLRPPVSRHARSDLGTYSKLNIVSTEESNHLLVKKPRKIKLKRHKSLSGISLRTTQATTNEDTKKDSVKKPRRKLKRSISFSGRFGNKNKGEDIKESQQTQIQKKNKELSSRKESLLSSSLMSRSISVDAGKKSMRVAVLPSASSCGQESSSSTVDGGNNTTRLTRRSSSAGNINTRYNCVNEVVPPVKLTIYRRNSFNGRLSIYDSFGHRLSMVETDLCSTEL